MVPLGSVCDTMSVRLEFVCGSMSVRLEFVCDTIVLPFEYVLVVRYVYVYHTFANLTAGL